MNQKRLEEIRGFLNYVVRTYPLMKPCLTGLHLTIDGWQPNRDMEGCKVKKRETDPEDDDMDWEGQYS